MKERPIIFSGPMVRAILEGRKTQTRRIIKPQPPHGCSYGINGSGSHAICSAIENPSLWVPPTAKSKDHRLICPYGQPGDRLWVRETWAYEGTDGSSVLPIQYRADRTDWLESSKWKPSIYMHRDVSRIDLQITGIRVERLRDITEEDAKAEGIEEKEPGMWKSYHDSAGWVAVSCSITSFMSLWESIHGIDSLDANPYLWVIELRRVKP